MNAEPTLRLARLNDVPRVVRMWQGIDRLAEPRPFGGDTPDKAEHAKSLIQHTIKSPKARVWVAETQQGIIGTISGHVYEKPGVKLKQVGVIYSLWVDAEHRQQGLGESLLKALENSLSELGAEAFQVGWDVLNTHAGHWWQKRGYSAYEVIGSKNKPT